jgi:hypothetical protein
MAPKTGEVLERFSHASAAKWKVIGQVVQENDWRPFVKHCLILFLAQAPFDIAALLWVTLR